MMPDASLLDYYARPGLMTDPKEHAALFAGLPHDVASLVKIVQGLMLHIFWAERYGAQLSEERKQEVQIRPVNRKLERILELDDRPLAVARPVERRLVGNCRDFSVMLTAMLRAQGIAARARCGFGMYFNPGHGEDHWVVEYWRASEQRWMMVDPQLDDMQQRVLRIGFDTLDMPPGHFLPAGKPWQECRAGKDDPDRFGIFDMHGLWFIRSDLVRDLLSLNKVEILPWDHWGLMSKKDEELSTGEWQALDQAAAVCLSGNANFDSMRSLCENTPGVQPPPDWQP
jgi:hypothetical protein